MILLLFTECEEDKIYVPRRNYITSSFVKNVETKRLVENKQQNK